MLDACSINVLANFFDFEYRKLGILFFAILDYISFNLNISYKILASHMFQKIADYLVL